MNKISKYEHFLSLESLCKHKILINLQIFFENNEHYLKEKKLEKKKNKM